MSMHFYPTGSFEQGALETFRELLGAMAYPFSPGNRIGIKLHWGEKGNNSFLPPLYAREIVSRLTGQGLKPFIFDTTVLYSGGRRNAKDSIETAAQHGFTPDYLGCDVIIADGPEGRDVIDLACGYNHFKNVQIADILGRAEGFVIFSHFKGHLGAGFGGAIKNLSMGFASRAQKQRMHADARPVLNRKRCTRCGACSEYCPTGAARMEDDGYPAYNLDECIGCAQCIALCPEIALRIFFNSNPEVFQEKLVETAAAVWKRIEKRSVLINALIRISSDCDCLPGKAEFIAQDIGFVGGYHPVAIDARSIELVGEEPITRAHPNIPWKRQFSYAREIGFASPEDE